MCEELMMLWCLQEDDVLICVIMRMQIFNEKIYNDEVVRNCNRVVEINNLVDYFRDEVESYEVIGFMQCIIFFQCEYE